jgi:hypothetical protein
MIELAEWPPSRASNAARFSRSAPAPPAGLRTEAGGCRGLEDKAGADALERRRQPDASSLKDQLGCSAAIRRSFANTARSGIEALDERSKPRIRPRRVLPIATIPSPRGMHSTLGESAEACSGDPSTGASPSQSRGLLSLLGA